MTAVRVTIDLTNSSGVTASIPVPASLGANPVVSAKLLAQDTGSGLGTAVVDISRTIVPVGDDWTVPWERQGVDMSAAANDFVFAHSLKGVSAFRFETKTIDAAADTACWIFYEIFAGAN